MHIALLHIFVGIFPLIYKAFNPAKDSFAFNIKLFSLWAIGGTIPICTATFLGKKYCKYFEKATKP